MRRFSCYWRIFKIPKIEFDYGIFAFSKIIVNSISLIKGKFNLNINARFNKDFERCFWFYELDSSYTSNSNEDIILPNLISLGPYYPWSEYQTDKHFNSDLKYPVFSNILLNSKTGKLNRIKSNFIAEARKEQLKIISNFYANYLKANNILLNHCIIIPVPAKPKYSFNSVEIICQEIQKIHNIPIELGIVERTSNIDKSFEIKNRSFKLNNINVLLIDDIFTIGATRDIIRSNLNEIGSKNISMITLGKTDHNIYEYDN